jgi:type I restriction enzyme, S subunit
VTIVRPPAGGDIDFFGHQLLSMEPQFEAMGVGSTGQTELAKARIMDTFVLRPPPALTEQFGLRMTANRELHVNLRRQNELLRAARDLLLPRLVAGELDVSELDLEGVLA